jgi:hypothetical protein
MVIVSLQLLLSMGIAACHGLWCYNFFCCEGVFCRLLGTVLTSCDISDLWVGAARSRPGLQLAGQLWIQIVVYSLCLTHFLLLVSYFNWAFDICRFCNIVITSVLRRTPLGLGMGQFLGGNTTCKTMNIEVPFSKCTILSIETTMKWHGFGKIWEQACRDWKTHFTAGRSNSLNWWVVEQGW